VWAPLVNHTVRITAPPVPTTFGPWRPSHCCTLGCTAIDAPGRHLRQLARILAGAATDSHGARLPYLGLGPKGPVGSAIVAGQACGQMGLAHSNSVPSQFPFRFIQFKFKLVKFVGT
jgi:hypothetical protein